MKSNIQTTGTAAGHGFKYLDPTPRPPVEQAIAKFCELIVDSGFPEPEDYTDITDRFFHWIEKQSSLLAQYEKLSEQNGQWQLNAQIGRWIKDRYGLQNGHVVPSKLSKLIKAYTTHSKL